MLTSPTYFMIAINKFFENLLYFKLKYVTIKTIQWSTNIFSRKLFRMNSRYIYAHISHFQLFHVYEMIDILKNTKWKIKYFNWNDGSYLQASN